MFKYNNTHIFTGYLKQFLASFNLPACKVYTHEFAKYLERYGTEDPRVLESFDTISKDRLAVRINYLKNEEIFNYFSTKPSLGPDEKRNSSVCSWRHSSELFYTSDKVVRGLTRTLNSPGNTYDTVTHEYLGEYLRFLRDRHNINLMSLYNCFNDKICNNIDFTFTLNPKTDTTSSSDLEKAKEVKPTFNSQNSEYRIYAIPVKLFSEYTIAIDCNQGIELFCGLYKTTLEMSGKAEKLAAKTYMKIGKSLFNQPVLYKKLNIDNWPAAEDFQTKDGTGQQQIRTDAFTRWDITNREKDLKLFIKIPTSCKSSIVILEGNYLTFNDVKYSLVNGKWQYAQNHSVLNFNTRKTGYRNAGDGVDLNNYDFKPISKLQLLALNTGESHPFADRLIEYLSGSAITPLDPIPDNIKRVQRVMEENKSYFQIEGLWENKMQNILYDYMVSSGPITVETVDTTDGKLTKLTDKRQGYHPRLGHTSKSTIFDTLGYVDRDTEKWYASWRKEAGQAQVKNSIQSVDIYDGLYDI